MLLKSTKGEIEVYLCPDPVDQLSPSKPPSSPEDYTDMSSEVSSTTGDYIRNLVAHPPLTLLPGWFRYQGATIFYYVNVVFHRSADTRFV